MRRWLPPIMAVAVWLLGGGVVASLLALAVGWSNGLAIAGAALSLGAVGWAVGPFKTPMVWSEGALSSYQGNAERPMG